MTTVRVDSARAGFTLIEVIAVLVILAVLAAVAIPRYVSLIDDARTQALEGAVAAGLSHVSMAYGREALRLGREPTAGEVATASGGANAPNSADYEFRFEEATGGVDVIVWEVDDATMTTTRLWRMP